jgi:hypothetical protein
MRRFAPLAGAAMVAATIYALRIDEAAGLIIDDAWYIVLAKALANGEGFRLISSATSQILPTVPPGFPALLAPVFFLNPSFPDNLVWLKLVSILAMGVVGVACYVDFTRHRDVAPAPALALSVTVVLTPSLVFLATSTVMAECVFLCLQLLGVIAIERAVRAPVAEGRAAVVAGVVAAATYLVRVTGLGLIAAGFAYFLVRRRYKQAAQFAAVVTLATLPWQLYAQANEPTIEERIAHGGTIAYPYTQLIAMDRPGNRVWMAAGDRLRRAGTNIAGVATRDIGALVMPVLYRGPTESGQEVVSVGRPGRGSMGGAAGTMAASLLFIALIALGIVRSRDWLSLPALLILTTVAMVGAVGSMTFRYVVPLAPFVLLYFWRGLANPGIARIGLSCVLGLHLLDHAGYVESRARGASNWLADAAEVEEVLSWLNGTAREGAVAATNPPLVYLRTGRKTIYLIEADKNWDTWLNLGIRHLAALQPAEIPLRARPRPDFQTGRHRLWGVEMEGRANKGN